MDRNCRRQEHEQERIAVEEHEAVDRSGRRELAPRARARRNAGR
jgi:hypothetical protein